MVDIQSRDECQESIGETDLDVSNTNGSDISPTKDNPLMVSIP